VAQPPYVPGLSPGSAPGPVGPLPQGTAPRSPQRPAEITTACLLAVTASVEWLLGLSLAWLISGAVASTAPPGSSSGPGLEAMLTGFSGRMLDGLALPLYLFPLAWLTTGFLVLLPGRWPRIVHTLLGAVALAWSAWWLWDDLVWWLPAAAYVAVSCAFLWTPAASRWYRRPAIGGVDPPR